MNSLSKFVQESDMWTDKEEKEVLNLLLNRDNLEKKSRKHYYVYNTYAIKSIGDIKKIVKKKKSNYNDDKRECHFNYKKCS